MKKEVSAGGIVLVGNAILMLKKYNGDWVLPKGRTKAGETLEHTAIREVNEETGVRGTILFYLGNIQYLLHSGRVRKEKTRKTVHWYLMQAKDMKCVPLKQEGFVEAKYIPLERALEIARYDDERKIIRKAADYYEKENQKGNE